MPFTPIHMGPGILVKAVLQSSFSLMIFGWSQIVMDLQPLFVLIAGEGHLHGFSHTYIGAFLLACIAALTGKYLSQLGLYILNITTNPGINISWDIAFLSALIGSFSHVFIDSIMHSDLLPFYPWSQANAMLGVITVDALHKFCLYSGLVGAGIYYFLRWRHKST